MENETLSRLAYGISQACEATGMGRSFIYQEISEGRIPTFKIGTRTLIAADDLKTWLNSYRSSSSNVADPEGSEKRASLGGAS